MHRYNYYVTTEPYPHLTRVKNIPRAHPIRPADLAQLSSEYQALAEDLSEVTRELRDLWSC
jgi:hypothetical protein